MSNLWIFTPDGFYSSRQDEWCNDDEVMVRARVYQDLLALADRLGIENPRITRLNKGDYLYRMKIKVTQWTVYCAHSAMDFTDGNGIKDIADMDRYMAYVEIWETMRWLQDLKDAELKGDEKKVRRLRTQFVMEKGWGKSDVDDDDNDDDFVDRRKKGKGKKKKGGLIQTGPHSYRRPRFQDLKIK